MAQGSGKLGRSKKSVGSQRKAVKTRKSVTKGRKQCHVKKANESARVEQDTTKAINKRNEALIAAKAVGVGTAFFLNDIKEVGKKELKSQNRERLKKEKSKSAKVTDRLKAQLKKLDK